LVVVPQVPACSPGAISSRRKLVEKLLGMAVPYKCAVIIQYQAAFG